MGPFLFTSIPEYEGLDAVELLSKVPIVGWPLNDLSGDVSGFPAPTKEAVGLDNDIEVFGCGLGFAKAFFFWLFLWAKSAFALSIYASYGAGAVAILSGFAGLTLLCIKSSNDFESFQTEEVG